MVKSSRTLEYRLLQDTPIFMSNKLNKHTGQKETFRATYAGGVFNVKFEDQIMTGAKWIRIVAKRIGHTGCRSAWESGLYVLLKNEDGKEIKYNMINIPILDKYKQHETEILNNTYLNISKNNNKSNNKEIKKTNNKKNNMPRKKAAKTNTKQKTIDRESALRIHKYEMRLAEWWNDALKETIEDFDISVKLTFALRKRPGCDNVYDMLNRNRKVIGTKLPWKDTENKYPSEFKNEDNIVTPDINTKVPEYEYRLEEDCIYHEMPVLSYFKYKYADIFGGFILTNQIKDNHSTLPLPLPPKVD